MKIQEINKLAVLYQRLSKGMIDHDKYTYYAITHHSTAIEGSTLTEKQAVNLLEYGQTAGSKPIEHHFMVLDYFNALEFTLKAAKEEKPITITLFKDIAAKVKTNTGEIVNTIIGTYNTLKVISSWKCTSRKPDFPDYKKVPEMVKKLCDSINTEIKTAKTFEDRCNWLLRSISILLVFILLEMVMDGLHAFDELYPGTL